MVQYKLYYFNFKGRAELSRLIFAAAGQQYEDVRLDKEKDWPSFKPKTPFGSIPLLEVHDGDKVFSLAQSISIARYLAKKFNLAGANDQEEAECNAYADQVTDLQSEMVKLHFEPNADKKAEMMTKFTNEILPKNAKIFEDKLSKTNTGFLIGNSLTWADLHLISVLEWLGDKKTALFEHFPLLKAHDQKIRNIPKIAKWIEIRPKTDM